MQTLLADIRYSLRNLRKNPGFAIVSILTLAIGLGANVAIFSFVDGVLLKPLPYPNPEEILVLSEKPPNGGRNQVSTENYLDWAKQRSVLAQAAAVSGDSMTLTGTGEPTQLNAYLVTSSYFDLFQTPAALGRTFAAGDDEPGKPKVVVLTNKIWKSRFGSDPQILNQSIRLNGEPHQVIGVLRENTVYERMRAEIWVPLTFAADSRSRSFHWLRVYGRIRPGVTLEQVRAEMDTLAARIAHDYPDSNKGWGIHVDRMVDLAVGNELKQSLWILLGAVGAVLLIGCANLANLLLARGAAREREVAIRLAVGAGRWRLIRQFLTESIVLAMLGSVAGLATGYGLVRALQFLIPPYSLPSQTDVQIDLRVLLFLIIIAGITGTVFGIAPALQATRRDAAGWLKEGGRGNSAGTLSRRLRNMLVVAEVCLAFVLLTGAGLLVRSLQRLLDVDPGFESTNVITMGLPLNLGKDADGERLSSYVRRVNQRISSLPGVRDAAFTSVLPLQGWGYGMWFLVAGRPYVDRSNRPSCFFKMISPSYFQTLGMRIRKGRGLSERDLKGGPPVTVINETMARRYFPNEEPIGKRILIQEIVTGKRELRAEIPWEVVGVVADEKVEGLDSASAGVYVPYYQSPVMGVSLLVRGAGDPAQLIKAIQHEVWEIRKDQPLTEIRTLEDIKSESVGSNKLRTMLLSLFAMIALLLSAVGIYGVVSYSVSQRTQEIGIRSALGAEPHDVLRLVVRTGMTSVLAGLALGVPSAIGLTRVIASFLFQTSATDASTMAGVGGVLTLVALAACYVPARRAMRVDPLTALRHD